MFGLTPWRKEKRRERELAPRPLPPLGLMEEFAPVFERFFGRWPELWEETIPLGLEMKETEKEYILRVEAPGFEPTEIEVFLADDRLTVRGEHKSPPEGEKKEEVIERRLERTILLPVETDPEKIEATYKNGILEVHLPRVPEKMPRRITVKT